MTTNLKQRPVQNITPTEEDDKWDIIQLPARFELQPQSFPLTSGWVLFSGVLHHRGGQDFAMRLIAEVAGKNSPDYFSLPFSHRGIISELIDLPDGIVKLTLEIIQGQGQFRLSDFSMQPIGFIELISKMVVRVVKCFVKYPYARCHCAGLRFYTPFLNLPKAYQIAGRFRGYSVPLSYSQWIAQFDVLSRKDRQAIQQQIQTWKNFPYFEIIITANTLHDLKFQQTLDALRKQLFQQFRVSVLLQSDEDNVECLNFPQPLEVFKSDAVFDLASFIAAKKHHNIHSTWIITVQAGVILAEQALYWLADEALTQPKACFIYADHDFINQQGERIKPHFKPDWSPELLRSTNYINCAATIRSDVLFRAGGLSLNNTQCIDYHDLFLRVTEQLDAEEIYHIPTLLWHLPCENCEKIAVLSANNPVAEHLKRLGVSASVKQLSLERFKISYDLPSSPPMISIIIPTRDALDHLKACIESVLFLSSYANFELIIVDNQSCEPSTLDYIKMLVEYPHIRVLHYPHAFNYSAINNFAAAEARGEILCLLNNDSEVITPNWMEEMLGHLLQKKVGIVGAKLYFSDGFVQHAGDVVGLGANRCAHHLHFLIERNAPGYCNRAIVAQELSAVTGACLMTWRKLFLDLGGLNERSLPVAFNDVDYCLRVREAGYRVVWTPHAELYHHESVSRGKNDTPEKKKRAKTEMRYIRKRWRHLKYRDPFYNPNLSYELLNFSLSNAPMIKKSWRNNGLF